MKTINEKEFKAFYELMLDIGSFKPNKDDVYGVLVEGDSYKDQVKSVQFHRLKSRIVSALDAFVEAVNSVGSIDSKALLTDGQFRVLFAFLSHCGPVFWQKNCDVYYDMFVLGVPLNDVQRFKRFKRFVGKFLDTVLVFRPEIFSERQTSGILLKKIQELGNSLDSTWVASKSVMNDDAQFDLFFQFLSKLEGWKFVDESELRGYLFEGKGVHGETVRNKFDSVNVIYLAFENACQDFGEIENNLLSEAQFDAFYGFMEAAQGHWINPSLRAVMREIFVVGREVSSIKWTHKQSVSMMRIKKSSFQSALAEFVKTERKIQVSKLCAQLELAKEAIGTMLGVMTHEQKETVATKLKACEVLFEDA